MAPMTASKKEQGGREGREEGEETALLVERNDDGVWILTLNRPHRGNAINDGLRLAMLEALGEAAKDGECRVMVITGKGKYFCTGMDLARREASEKDDGGKEDDMLSQSEELFEAVDKFPKPVIGLLNGPAHGGGVGLALCTDIRIAASPKISFHLPEVHRGLVPALISRYVVRELGPSQARAAMLTGKPLHAQDLYHWGVFHQVVSGGDSSDSSSASSASVKEWAKELAKGGPIAQNRVKQLVDAAANPPSPDSVGEQARLIRAVFQEMMAPSEEAVQGIMQFQMTKGKEFVDWAAFYRDRRDQTNRPAKL